MPPVISAHYPEADAVWTLQPGPNIAYVRAQDADEGHQDRLEFFWTLGRFGELGTAVPISGNEAGSQLTLLAERKYDGSILRCRVVDPEGGSAEIAWEVDYEEEDR